MSEGTNKAVFFKGIRLWKGLKYWRPVPASQAQGDKAGISRKLGRLSHRSPNFLYDIIVHTSVPPVTAIGDLGRQESLNVTMLQVLKALVEASTPPGDLAWVQDITEKLDITGVTPPGSYPDSGTIAYTDGTKGFTPAVGDLVLIRQAGGPNGFVTTLTAASPGSISCVLDEAIDASWEVLLVRYYFPECKFSQFTPWEATTQAEDSVAFDMGYLFRSQAHPVWPSEYDVVLGT